MAMFTSKIDEVTKVLSANLESRIHDELNAKLMALVRSEIHDICTKVTRDLVQKIESYNSTSGEINVNILFKDVK